MVYFNIEVQITVEEVLKKTNCKHQFQNSSAAYLK